MWHFVKIGLSLSDAALCLWVPHLHSDNGTIQFLAKFWHIEKKNIFQDPKFTKLEHFEYILSQFLTKISQIHNINLSNVFWSYYDDFE